MATEALKSASITLFDTPTIPTAGMGAEGVMRVANDSTSSTAGVTVGSTYRLVRIPTNAKIKAVQFTCSAHTTSGAFDIDVAHSDSTTDGTPPSLQGNIVQISAADNKLFGSAVSATSALNHSDVTFSGTFTPAHSNLELWNVLVTLGATTFSSDPGGFFDLMLKSTTTDTVGGSLALQCFYVVN